MAARNDNDELVKQLRSWGFAKVNRYAAANDGEPRAAVPDHPIMRARRFEMSKTEFLRKIAGRDGEARRRRMAAGLGATGIRILPEWAADAVPCNETRVAGPLPSPSPAGGRVVASIDPGVPEDLRWIDRAFAALARENLMRSQILQEEYTGVGTQEEKAKRLCARHGVKLSVDQYQRELRRALDFMRGKRAA
jgi:hypothetical protein